MKLKRITALVLALVLLVGVLAGCGSKGTTGETTTTDTNGGVTSATGTSNQTGTTAKYAYVATYLDIPIDVNGLGAICISGNMLYFSAQVASGKETYTDEVSGESYDYDVYENKVYQMNLDTQECTELTGYVPMLIPEGVEGSSNVNKMAAGADGTLWICDQLYTYSYDLPENFDPATDDQWNYYTEGENKTRLVQLSATGEQLREITLQPTENGNTVSSFVADSAGNIYCSDWENVYLYDKDGNLSATLEVGDNANGDLRQYSADQAGVLTYGETSGLKLIDPVKKDWGETIALPNNAYQFYPGDETYDLYYDYNGSIYGYLKDTDTSEKVVDWMACDINSNDISSYTMTPDGRVVAVIQSWEVEYVGGNGMTAAVSTSSASEGNYNTQVVILTKTDVSAVTDKTVLTLACMYLDWNLRAQIVSFNKSSDKYRIQVADYSEYNTDEDYSAGLTKLNTEIMSGKIPDILCTGNMPIAQYAAKGILEDLYPYIQSDTELNGNLMEDVLAAMETDGKLYQIGTSFSVQTCVGLSKVVDGYDIWNLASLQDAMTKLQDGATVFNTTYTKSDILTSCLSQNISSFVDWEAGSCSFSNKEFVSLLEFANTFPTEFDYTNFDWETDYVSDNTRMRNGQQLLNNNSFSDFSDFQFQNAAYGGEAISFVGYPTESGNGNSFSVNGGLAISTTCADKDAAWAFIHSLLIEDAQTGGDIWSFPMNKAAFEKKAEKAMTPEYELDENGQPKLDENGNKVEQSQGTWYMDNSDNGVEIYAMTQAQYDQLMALIHSTNKLASYDENIMKIITDETAGFFAGEKDAQSTADMIQSRVSLYVAEQG